MTPRWRWPVPTRLIVVAVLVALAAAGSGAVPASISGDRGVRLVTVEFEPNRAPPLRRPVEAVPPAAPAPPRPVRVAACHPSGEPIPVAAVDPTVAAKVDRAWGRIERWLARYAPVSYGSLRPPASTASIARTQAVLGRRLPPELVASLRRHDGVAPGIRGSFPLPPFHTPMTAAAVASDWTLMCGVTESLGDTVGEQWWSPAYTAFAAAGDGGSLLLDQRPGRRPHVGEYFSEDGTDFTRWPASLTDLLEITAQALQTGRSWGHYRPTVHTGALSWDILR